MARKKSSEFLPTVFSGLIMGVGNLGGGLATSALLFSGALAAGLNLGITVVLLSYVVLTLGLRSSKRNAVGQVQELGTALLSASLIAMTTHQAGSSDATLVATALVIIGSATLVTGVVFVTFGLLHLGSFARFIPFPVVAGFLGGAGWLLVTGSFSIIANENNLPAIYLAFLNPTGMLVEKTVATVVFSVTILFMMRRFSHPLIFPALLVAAVSIFYVVMVSFGVNMDQARALGWLSNVVDPGTVPPLFFSFNEFKEQIVWQEVWAAFPIMLSIALLNVLGILMSNNGLELATGCEMDSNRELRNTGLANLLAGLLGGPSGFVDMGMTTMAEKMGATTRWVGFSAALVTTFGLLYAVPLVSVIPAFFTPGILLFLGIDLIIEWLLETRNRLPLVEWLLVVVIVTIVATTGFLEGLGAGLVISVVLFVVNYSRQPIFHAVSHGAETRSNVDRSFFETRYLQQHGESIAILQIQGYLFFGTANGIVSWIRERVMEGEKERLGYVILDLRRVQGADSSAMICFTKIRKLAELNHFKVVFAHLSMALLKLLLQSEVVTKADGILFSEPDLDRALKWCEEDLLDDAEEKILFSKGLQHHFQALLGPHPRIPELIQAMERMPIEEGTRLIRRGDAAEEIFFIERGNARITITLADGRTLHLRTVRSGSIIGEIALYTSQTRTADVVTDDDGVVFCLRFDTLRRLEVEDSELAILFHRLLARSLAEKLVTTTASLCAAQR